LCRDGLVDIVVLTGHGGDAIERSFGNGSHHGVRIAYSREETPLGTGGALRLAASRFPADRYLVLNGDSFLDARLDGLLQAHLDALDTGVPTRATLALAEVPDTRRFGRVELASDGAVTAFTEKGAGGRGLISAGIVVLEDDVLQGIPPERPVSLERETFPGLVGHGLRGVAFDAAFGDIGTPDSYAALVEAPQMLTAITSAGQRC
jgi:NDP-sugar pyrophosphorylase family protein